MPLPAIAIGAGIGIGLGYLEDRYRGDGHYTAEEMAVDATLGAIGGGIFKGVKYGGRAVKWTRMTTKARKSPTGTAELRIFGIRSGAHFTAKESSEIAMVYTVLAGANFELAAIGYASDVYTNREKPTGKMVRNAFDSDRVVTRHPIALLLANQHSDKSSKSTKRGRPKKRCRCKDGTYSTKCCK